MNSAKAFICKAYDLLLQAWKALSLHRLRSLLSTLGIVFAVAAVVTMLAIAEGAKRETLEQIGRLGIDSIIIRNAAVDDGFSNMRFRHVVDGLGNQDVRVIKQIPMVENITFVREIKVFLAELGGSDVTNILEVNQDFIDVRGLRIARGRFVSDIDVQNRNRVCVLGAELANRLGNGGRLGATVHFDGDPYRVVGVLHMRGHVDNETLPLALRDFDKAAFIPLQGANHISAAFVGDKSFSEIIIKISDNSMIDSVSMTIRNALLFNRSGVENFELVVPKELLTQARQAQRLFNIVLGSIAGISLLVGGIGIMNIMLANVSERTREIGIRRAVGASRRHIIAHFLGESILLTIIGGILGIILGSFASLGINIFIQWHASISLWSMFSALLMSIGVGVVAGIYPAVKAAAMDPVDALRHI